MELDIDFDKFVSVDFFCYATEALCHPSGGRKRYAWAAVDSLFGMPVFRWGARLFMSIQLYRFYKPIIFVAG